MPLRLYNTLSGKIEEFHPLDDNRVRMYACGPTVYDYGHIGNFRTFIAVDLLYRFLRQSGYDVRYVMNITDVDDKIIRNSARDGVTVQQYTAKFIQAFLDDSTTLSIEPPVLVRATEHINAMADFIAELVKKGFAYRTDDGSYYFRIAKFPEYGKLSKKDFAGMTDGARVDVDEYEKDSARDFALWKAPKPGEASWDTSIGPGRPGWHIECSVMSMEQFGPSFDLHAGGEDLIFPHHENEIAQSEALTGKQFVRYWFHARFLLVEGQKMSKSLGNFFTIRDLVLRGHKPSSIRWLLTQVPYRNQLNFTFDGLKAAASSVESLRDFYKRLTTDQEKLAIGSNASIVALAKETSDRITNALNDDLNTAEAQGAIFDMLRKANTALDTGEVRQDDVKPLRTVLEKFDEIFGVLKDDDQPKMKVVLDWAKAEGRENEISSELEEFVNVSEQLPDNKINELLEEMEAARKSRNFELADIRRAQLTNASVMVLSTKDGPQWKRKSYKTSIRPLSPVAIKLNQWEVHAPDHETWGVVTCDICKQKFALGPNRIYGSTTTKERSVKELEDLLKKDHQQGRLHPDSYELTG
jgi:cysteinyl-tRNA synthetase